MNIIKHNWNGSAIAQLTEITKISKFEVPAGYVNATQMCKACGKLFADYMRLSSTESFLKGLSTDMGIPISGLTIIIKGGNDKQSQGTWVHPEIAIDLAQWVSVEFRIWANRTLRQVMQFEVLPPQLEQTQPDITPEQLMGAYSIIIDKFSISEELKATYLLRAMEAQYPGITPSVQKLLPNIQPKSSEEYVSPTRLSQIWNDHNHSEITPRRINEILESSGYQISYYKERTSTKTGKLKRTKCYSPTDLGNDFSTFVLDKASSDKTVQVLRWKTSILEEIKEELNRR